MIFYITNLLFIKNRIKQLQEAERLKATQELESRQMMLKFLGTKMSESSAGNEAPTTPEPVSDKPENMLGYHLKVKASYDFAARDQRELTIKKGDIIKVLDKDDSGWWMGELPNGKYGIFPSNYTVQHELKPIKSLKLATKGICINSN